MLLVGCVTEGNELSGSWRAADGGLFSGAEEGECIGDATVTMRAAGDTTTSDVDCDDGGFKLLLPYEATRASIEIRDDWSDTIRFDVTMDGNVDLGSIYFAHFGDGD